MHKSKLNEIYLVGIFNYLKVQVLVGQILPLIAISIQSTKKTEINREIYLDKARL